MTTTPFLKLEKPPFDTIPWDEAVNGNMDILDGYISQFMNIPNFTGAWVNATSYVAGQNTLDTSNGIIYICLVTHTSAASPTTFAQDRAANPSYWQASTAGNPGSSYAPINSPAFTGTPTAPTPAITDNTTKVATTAFVQSVVTPAIGKNYIHNGQFNIAARGNGPFTTSVYTVDRWIAQVVGDTISWNSGILSDGSRTQIGDEEPNRYLSNTFTGNAAAGSCNYLQQRIEGVRRLGGKTVTVSFWASCGSGTPKMGVNILQSFGTGGSPSAAVRALAVGASFTLSIVLTRYHVTIPIPTTIGKTLGSNGDDYTALEFWFSSGSTFNAVAGNIGVQANAVNIWGVQLELGSDMTDFEKIEYSDDYRHCQRFFQVSQILNAGYSVAAVTIYQTVLFPVTMRASPSIVATNQASVNITGPNISVLALAGNQGAAITGSVTATGPYLLNCTYTASADL